jgi:endonuclease/exonuclease/phosphatase family metal-dependent hydrolase
MSRVRPLPVRARVALAPLLALLAGTLACTQLALTAEPDVRVLVYNIHAGWDPAGQVNLERVAELVRTTGADIVLLQEVDRMTTRSNRVDQVARLSGLTRFHAAFGRTLDYQGGHYGIAILSRWPILRDTLIQLPVEPPQQRAGGSYEPRGMLHAVVDRPGMRIHVFNTHMDASRDDHYRRQEIRTVAAVAASARERERVLLGGDLNAEPGSAVVNYVTGEGWRDAFAECGTGDGLTYPYDVPVKRIDYLLLSNGWRCREARVLESDVSDHRPLLVRLAPTSR